MVAALLEKESNAPTSTNAHAHDSWKAPGRAWIRDPEVAALVRRVSGMLLQPYRSSSSTVVDGQPQQRQQARPVVVVDTTSAAAAAVAGVTPLRPVFDDSAVTAALIALRRDLSVRLCVADKGGAMVVWSRPS